MGYFVGDTFQVALQYESGTYATASGTAFWPGLVQSNDITESQGHTPIRYAGASSRNVDTFVNSSKDFTGTLTFFPQDFRSLKFALGKNLDGGSPSPYTHTYTEADNDAVSNEIAALPIASFTLEDSKQTLIAGSGLNDVRTANGCVVDSWSLNLAPGEPARVELGYIAQDVTFSSGAVLSVSADTTTPYMHQHWTIAIPSGTVFNQFKSASLSINNSQNAPHYINGSRLISAPIPENREYEVSLTLDAHSDRTKTLRESYWLGGSTFNMQWIGTASTGSRVLELTMSGCKLMDLGETGQPEGVIEQTLTIKPQVVSAIETSTSQYYNAGSYAVAG